MNEEGVVEKWNDSFFLLYQIEEGLSDYADRAVFSNLTWEMRQYRGALKPLHCPSVYTKKYDQLSIIHDKVQCEE